MKRFEPRLLPVFGLAGAYVLAHAFCGSLAEAPSNFASFFLAALVSLPAVILSFRQSSRSTGPMAVRWFLWALSQAFFVAELLVAGGPHLPGMGRYLAPILGVLSCTLPLLVLASSAHLHRSRLIQATDAVLALAVCGLCAAAMLLPHGAFYGDTDFLAFLTFMRFIPTAASAVALQAADTPEEYGLLRLIVWTEASILFAAVVLNQVLVTWLHIPGTTAFDLLMGIPGLVAFGLMRLPLDAAFQPAKPNRFVARSGLPLFFTLILLVLGGLLVPHHLVLGMLTIAAATLGYVLRTTLENSSTLEAEERLRLSNIRLRGLANHDPLTGIGNRRFFDAALQQELASTSFAVPLSLLLIDLDHFKQINDRLGHLYGDRCLRAVAETLRRVAFHPGDAVCRLGGDEFALLLPGADRSAARHVAERIALHLRQLDLEGADAGPLTVSLGLAVCLDRTRCTADDLLREADDNLYQAKRSGRGRTQLTNEDAVRFG